MRHSITTGIAAALLAGLAVPATASSDDAWEEFRAEVEGACTALVEAPEGATVTAQVNPFGTESYGAALMTVTVPGDEDGDEPGYEEVSVCIFDKQDRSAELTGPFPAPDEAAAESQ
ncbi:hypothetical protein MLD63_10830 [Paracoccus sp. TK19116]|uniref:Uncharacterized protein n=1 Tax=Paracoccus albicereus TaxID=2922394 RepID=A0ABT1MRH7_9RHOB|nr:hypothetical protein [Paracoccus albicereus]MCQ0970919.1 hypothetical protein [Paracoccus albicereus]